MGRHGQPAKPPLTASKPGGGTIRGMSTVERAFDRATRRADRARCDLGDEFRETRIAGGWSQARVAEATRMSRSRCTRIEGGKIEHLSIADASRIAAVLGLDLSVRLYPGAGPLRDEAHARRLGSLLKHVRGPLTQRTEVPLPALAGRTEQRSWDAVIFGHGTRTAVEMEMRLRNGQALERRIALKRRDDPTERFLLVVAETHVNRRVLASNPGLFPDLPRLGPARVTSALNVGQHPPTGLVVL